MSSTPTPVSPAISAEASIPTPHLRKRSCLAALCSFLVVLVCSAGGVASAQTDYANFGTVNAGTTSPSIPLVFTFGTADTLASVSVLTQGATGLDFADAGSDTCTANTAYLAGQNCTVNVTFTPRFSGNRIGAVVLEDSSGNAIATGRLQGTGVGPQINFLPGTQIAYATGGTGPVGVAVDGNGDIYFSLAGSGVVFEVTAVNGVVPPSPTFKTIASGFGPTIWMAMDGGGNLYLSDTSNGVVKEILAVNGVIPSSPTIRTLGSGFSDPTAIAVDGTGNVYVTGLLDGTVKEILAVNGTIPASPTIKILSSSFKNPTGIAVDTSGDVFVSDEYTYLVKEILAVNGSIPTSPTINTLGSNFSRPYGLAVDGAGNVYVADYGNNAVKEILAASGYVTVKTLGSGFTTPGSVVLAGSGNIYVGDYGNDRIVELDLADPPSLTFASTGVGATSSDSPRTVTIENIGNAELTFPVPSTGNNPSISTNFTLNSSGSLDCTLLTTESSAPATLAPGASCQLPISFVPTALGALSGSLVLTDNHLNAPTPGYASQGITLSGTGTSNFTLGTSPSSLTITQGTSGTSTITVTPEFGFTGSVTLSATGLPAGVTASFSPSTTTGTSVLTLTASSLSSLPASQAITVTGTSGSLTETTTLLLTVNPGPNFILGASPTVMTLPQGGSGNSTITVTGSNGFAGSLSLSASNLPLGVTASFSPVSTTGTSVLTLTVSSTATVGPSSILITGTSGSLVAETSLPLTVSTFTLSSSPTSLSINQGTSGTSNITVNNDYGFTGNVSLVAGGLPNGVTASFSQNPTNGSSVLTLTASSFAVPGYQYVTIAGTSGTLTKQTNIGLTVNPPPFTITSSVASAGLFQGDSLTSIITVTPQSGFSGSVSLTASGLASGLSASFSSNPTTGTSILTLAASPSATPGNYPVAITGTFGTQTATITIDISIVAVPPGFLIESSPMALTVFPGGTGNSTITVVDEGGYTGSVSLAASGLPSGVTASFSPNPSAGNSILTLTASSSAALATNLTVTVTGISGNLTAEAFVYLTIAQPGFAPSSENFGAVNIGTGSPVQTLTYTFGSAVTLGSTAVLTQAASGLDFADAGSDTCTANAAYFVGESCIINVTFAPEYAGTRFGAVVLYDTNGNAIATGLLQGTGVGPQVNFLPGAQTSLGSGFAYPWGAAVDGNGNVYVADFYSNAIYEMLAVNGRVPNSPTIRTLGSGFGGPRGVAVDSAGNVYVADSANGEVKEMLAVNGSIPDSPTILIIGPHINFSTGIGFNDPMGVAVDANGNVFVTDGNLAGVPSSMPSVFEIMAVNGSIPPSPNIVTLYTGVLYPYGLAVDTSGDVYFADPVNNAVYEMLAVNGSIPASPTLITLGTGFNAPEDVAIDGSGNLYVADAGNGAVKKLLAVNGSIPSVPVIETLVTAFGQPDGVAVDGAGNVFVADGINSSSGASYGVWELDYSDAPSLTFATTVVGSTSSDSPQTVTVENVGNAALTFPVPSSGSNPSIGANFTFNSGGSADCLLVSSGSSTAGTLAPGASCLLPVNFVPGATGALSAFLTLTDNNLNAAAPGYASQNIALNGISTQNPPSFTLGASPSTVTVVPGAVSTSGMTVAGSNGFNGSVSLTASGLPTAVTASFSPNPATGSSVLTVTASSTAATGTYSVTITGTSGSLTAATTIVLTIEAAPGFASSTTNFEAVNIGTRSSVQTLTYTFGNAVTLGATAVLTQGATGLDFANAGTGTCVPNVAYAAEQSCTVNVSFTPTYAGARYGAVVLTDTAGNVIATGYLQGTGLGPQVNFLPNFESTVASAGLLDPYGVAVDGSGNVYIADSYNNRILKETLSAGVYTESTIPTSSLYTPLGIAVDGSGNIYIADTNNYRVLKETLGSGGYTESIVADLTANQFQPFGVAVDGSGNVYFTYILGTIYVETLSGGVYTESTIQTDSSEIADLAVDASGNIYVADIANDQILVESPSVGGYTQSTVPTTGLGTPWGIAVDGNGNVFITDVDNNTVLKETLGAGGYVQSAITTSALDEAFGVAVDGSGNVYIADTGDFRILKEDFADAPSLTFATTASGSTSSDSPRIVTVENVGNAPLSFPVPSGGSNPSIAANFTLNTSAPSACPQVTSGSTAGKTLAPGTFCLLPISFVPTTGGALNGSLVLTDNNLNAAASGYTSQSIALSGTATQITPVITWTTPAAITYGTPLSAAQLNATSTVAGTFTYSPTAGTVLGAGQHTLNVTFTPTGTGYSTATASVALTVKKAALSISWPAPAAISYGTALSGTQLDATSTAAGTFVYSPPAGTVLAVGKQTLTVTFTPTNAANYTPSTATASVTLTVNKATPPITWATPAAITYGTALSATQLNATSTVAGTFAYSPAIKTVLSAGQQTLNVTFTPNNTVDYTTATASVTLTVNKAAPVITWAAPKAIAYGTALSATQLNATSTVAGTFKYSPVSGTVLSAGQQTLTVTLTPTNTTDYATATASVTLTVNKVTPTITWPTPKAITFGTALSTTQLDASSTVAGTFAYSPAAGTVLSVGQQTLTVTFTPTNTTDFATATANVTLTVNPAPSFTLGASPASLTVAQGASGKTTITVSGKNGFAGSVTLAASGLPSGVTATFGTNPTTGASVLTLTASGTAATGTATVAINGTSGSLTASTTVVLTISCTPTTIVPYIYVNGAWIEESTVTVSSTSVVVDLGPQPTSGGTWSWTGPSGYTSTSRQINSIPLTVGTDSYLATYTNASGCKSTETFAITVK